MLGGWNVAFSGLVLGGAWYFSSLLQGRITGQHPGIPDNRLKVAEGNIFILCSCNARKMADSYDKGIATTNFGTIADDRADVNTTTLRRRKWWHLGGEDIVFVPVRNDGSGSSKGDFDTNVTETADGTVFSDSRTADIYAPIEKYEGAHRFDPKATWTEEEELALVRRVRIDVLLPKTMGMGDGLTSHRSTGRSASGLASCSLLYNLTAVISCKH